MKKFSGYSETEARDFTQYEKIEVGGHYCKILDVKIEEIQGKNGKFEQLLIKFDTDENDKQPRYYSTRYKQDVEKDATKAKWKGYYKIFIPKDDGTEQDEKSKVNFKTFITCIEKSNSGYDWEKSDWNEKTLVGKKFVGVFGIEEFTNLAGELVWATKCRFVRSTDSDLEKVGIPKVRLIDNTYMDYEEWLEKGENDKLADNIINNSNNVEDEDSDLPF